MAIYMKIDGIEGNVTAKGYEKWIEIHSLNWSVSRNINAKPGNVADRETTKPTVSEIKLNKIMDLTSPHLFIEACIGKAKPSVKIHVCQTGDNISPYMEYTLNNVLVSNYVVQATKTSLVDSIAAPIETISLNFDKIEMKYTPYDASHKAQSPVPTGYDLKTAQKI